ncbi:ATP-binding cassette domain-containing protein [Thorsellia kenyensis]|uniref:ATP-binding cassette domain-containing protein n=1 Tax=Thorsellia kenyensis TaxID=1549888 RepID=A0ABV6CAX0_9GAMM
MPSNIPFIEFKHVDKKYEDRVIFNNLSFNINKGDFITLTGTSGGGKTTFLRMINGMVIPDKGEILINQEAINKQDILALRRNIGYAIQGSGLFPHMTIKQNMLYVPELSLDWNDAQKNARVLELLDIVSLDNTVLSRFPDELSGGQQQRVSIARALAANPDILLMDEPFGALDSETRTQLQDSIKSIQQRLGVTIVFITHDEIEARLLGTRSFELVDGHLTAKN